MYSVFLIQIFLLVEEIKGMKTDRRGDVRVNVMIMSNGQLFQRLPHLCTIEL